MENIDKLKEYYKQNCSPLIFVNETTLPNNKNAKVFLYNFNTSEELENFKKVFQEYLPFYVLNLDLIDNYIVDDTISKQLVDDAKYIYETDITPTRKTGINGIFGELYNDYYIKNVLNDEILLQYLSRKDFNSRDSESKGIDVVACNENEGKLEIIMSEAKFVGNLSTAKNNLKDDISGSTGHLNKEYINKYMNFVMYRQNGLDKGRNKEIQKLVTEFNTKKWREKLDFIDCINELDCSCRFIYFAVFKQCKKREIHDFEEEILEIIQEFNQNIANTGINNYSIEVVFIPTFNESMALKRKMEEW